MKKYLKHIAVIVGLITLLLPATACMKKTKVTNGKANVEFRWRHHYNLNRSGWIEVYGELINRGTKRADWVKVTIHYIDKKTGVVVGNKSQYIKDGSGPNSRSIEPGEIASYNFRLDTKKKHPYRYEREVTWTEPK